MCFCYQMGGWMPGKRGSERWEPKEKQEKHYYYFFTCLHLILFICGYLLEKKVHSLNASVNKHPFVGIFPKSKQGTWAVSPRTSVWDSEERVWKLHFSLQILRLSCYSSPPPAPGSSHSPPLFVSSHWGFGGVCRDVVTDFSLGCEDEHLE